MAADWVASLPMYDFPELQDAHDALWGALAARLATAGLTDVPRALTRGATLPQVWGSPRLLFGQGCEYPLAKRFGDRVRVVAHPVYAAAGCEGPRYRSAIVVRRVAHAARPVATLGVRGGPDDVTVAGEGGCTVEADVTPGAEVADGVVNPEARVGAGGGEGAHRGPEAIVGQHAAPALNQLRGQRCVVNELDSNSGMNLLRAAIAPLAKVAPLDKVEPFFSSVAVSGSHLRSVEMVASGEADVAAIDCVSFAHFQRLYPSLVAGVRVLSWTASTPSLPYITAGTASDDIVQALRAAIAHVFDDNGLAQVRERLLLRGVDLSPKEGFGEVLNTERAAVISGYPILR